MNLYSTPEPVEPLQESNPQSYKVFVYDQNNKVVYETSLTADQDQPESYFDVKVPLGDHYQLVILDQTEKKVFEESL